MSFSPEIFFAFFPPMSPPALAGLLRKRSPERGIHHLAVGLIDLERELKTRLVEYAALSEAWPRASRVLDRAAIGKQVDATLKRIHEIEKAIVGTQAFTLADAAEQLRRLGVMIEDPACRRLVAR